MNKGWDFSLHFFHTFILHSLLLSHFFFFPLLPGSATSQGLEITKMPHNVSFPQTRESCLSVALPFQWDDPVLRQPGCSFTMNCPSCPTRNRSQPGKSWSSERQGPKASFGPLFLEEVTKMLMLRAGRKAVLMVGWATATCMARTHFSKQSLYWGNTKTTLC